MADGCTELVFHYKGRFNELLPTDQEQKSFISGLHGPSDRFKRFKIDKPFGILGAYLYPHAVNSIFSLPVSETVNQMIDLTDLPGTVIGDLEENIFLAKTKSQMVKLLVEFIEEKLRKGAVNHYGITPSIELIIKNKGTWSVNALAQEFCYSMRQFERKFKEVSGFSPKHFSRIIRFQSSMEAFGEINKPLTEIAYGCGYYDQSHFIQDFKQFSGHHPKHFFSGKAEGMSWML
jgi:AraC-like DNA-binding protein